MLYFAKRTIGTYVTLLAKKVLYTALVRSHLEYGTVIWSPFTAANLKIIESIQRRATNYILKNPRRMDPKHMNYND